VKCPQLVIFQRADGLFDWHLKAKNGRVLCGSVQGYRTRYEANRAFDAVVDAVVEVVS
jgi:uncharacterized protein YegP (UPF0339 family)